MNHFTKPFDEGTKVKLEIFREYFKEWLPVFLSKKKCSILERNLHI